MEATLIVKGFLQKLVAVFLLAFHAVPTSVLIANPLIGMIQPILVEWFLLSPWNPFYAFYATRWLVFDKISIPNLHDVDLNPLVGWSLFAIGICIFSVAAFQFFIKRKEGFVTAGLYSKVRHPQYLGIIVATLGFTFASERPMAWIAWLNLTFLYILLANGEEKILEKSHRAEIQIYKQNVPFILPFLPPNITRKLPTPKSKLRKWLILLLTYFLVIAVAWLILKQFSYHPGPFWQ